MTDEIRKEGTIDHVWRRDSIVQSVLANPSNLRRDDASVEGTNGSGRVGHGSVEDCRVDGGREITRRDTACLHVHLKTKEIGALSVEPDCIGDSHRGEGNAKGEREGVGKGKPLQTDENEEGELANTMEGDKEVRWHYFYF